MNATLSSIYVNIFGNVLRFCSHYASSIDRLLWYLWKEWFCISLVMVTESLFKLCMDRKTYNKNFFL